MTWTAEKNRIAHKKHVAKERGLGYEPINTYFDGSCAHHVDTEHIIYIPSDVHNAVRHRMGTQSMQDINILAFAWMESSVL